MVWALGRLLLVIVAGTVLWGSVALWLVVTFNLGVLVAALLGGAAGIFGYLSLLAIPRVWRWVING